MAENSKIEWTHHTFNPWRGCTKISPGCANCYAEKLSHRNPSILGEWGPDGKRVVAAESAWKEPLKWDRKAKEAGERHRVFCASLADVFEDWKGPVRDANDTDLCVCHKCGAWVYYIEHCECGQDERLPRKLTLDDVRARLFKLIDATPNLDWLLLTKRPENIAAMMPAYYQTTPSENWFFDPEERKRRGLTNAGPHQSTMTVSGVGVVRPNVWLGTSVEDRKHELEQAMNERVGKAAVR